MVQASLDGYSTIYLKHMSKPMLVILEAYVPHPDHGPLAWASDLDVDQTTAHMCIYIYIDIYVYLFTSTSPKQEARG